MTAINVAVCQEFASAERIRPVDLLAAPEFVGKEESCVTVLNALIPVFGLILLGWFMGARRILPSDGGATLSIITFKLMMPVLLFSGLARADLDRKSTRLNSSHVRISYAVFCLKKKKILTSGQVNT